MLVAIPCTLTIASEHEKLRGTNNCDDLGEGAAECFGRYWYAFLCGFLREKRTGIAKGSRGYAPGLSLPDRRVHVNRRSIRWFYYCFRLQPKRVTFAGSWDSFCPRLKKRFVIVENYETEVIIIDSEKLLRYSMQLAMLNQLRSMGLITEEEYNRILRKLKRDYGVISHLDT